MSKPVILTGIRANNDLHIGNYFGAMLPIIDMAKRRSEEFDVNLFIPDLHSFTTPINHDELFDSIMNNARVYTAAGLDVDDGQGREFYDGAGLDGQRGAVLHADVPVDQVDRPGGPGDRRRYASVHDDDVIRVERLC